MTPSNFSLGNFQLDFPTSFPISNILWIVLFLAIIIFVIATAVLIYHWRSYGMGMRKFFFVETLYICVAIIFIIMATISILFV